MRRAARAAAVCAVVAAPAAHGKDTMRSMPGMSPPGGRPPPARAPTTARPLDFSGPALHPGTGTGETGAAPPVHDDPVVGRFLVDRLERFHGRDGNGSTWDIQAWAGRDYNRVWLKTEGSRSGGKTEGGRVEVLWSRPVSAFWDLQAGVRRDIGPGSRNWVALGVQGLAPYWFDVEATAYAGPQGRTAALLKAEYELLLTQRLILTPRIEASLYGRSDRTAGVGSGLSDVQVGTRLRFEFWREFAPYAGIEWGRRLARTADFAREAGAPVSDRKVVAGVRLWF